MATVRIKVEGPEGVKVCWNLYLRSNIPEKAQNSSSSHHLCDKYCFTSWSCPLSEQKHWHHI